MSAADAAADASSPNRIGTFTATFLPDNHYHVTKTSCSICQCADRADDPPKTYLSSQMEHISPTQIIRANVCGHVFHELCIQTWVATQLALHGVNAKAHHVTCPMCRTVLLEGGVESGRDLVAEESARRTERRERLRGMEGRLEEATETLRRLRAEMEARRE
jgi:hypothetical protein